MNLQTLGSQEYLKKANITQEPLIEFSVLFVNNASGYQPVSGYHGENSISKITEFAKNRYPCFSDNIFLPEEEVSAVIVNGKASHIAPYMALDGDLDVIYDYDFFKGKIMKNGDFFAGFFLREDILKICYPEISQRNIYYIPNFSNSSNK